MWTLFVAGVGLLKCLPVCASVLQGEETMLGTIKEFPIPTANSYPFGITAGPDGNLWFTENFGNKIGRITPGGVIREFPISTANSQPQGIAPFPGGNLWFCESNGNKIGEIAT
jgi:virginiamycin B lyase